MNKKVTVIFRLIKNRFVDVCRSVREDPFHKVQDPDAETNPTIPMT